MAGQEGSATTPSGEVSATPWPAPIDAVVVAGGASRRLGQDKALLPRGDRRQVDHVVTLLRPLGGNVIVAHGARVLTVPRTLGVSDATGMVGPVAGVVAGLRAAGTELVAIVGVDLVHPHAGLLRALASHVRAHDLPGAMPIVGEDVQPLHAVVRRSILPTLERAGDRLVSAFATTGVTPISPPTWRVWAPRARPGDDLDTPADVRALRIREGRRGERP